MFDCLCVCVQILTLYDSVDVIDKEGVVRYITGLQQPDGSFHGDKWGEQTQSVYLKLVSTIVFVLYR